MIKRFASVVLVMVVLLAQRPHAQATARILFVDIGSGASRDDGTRLSLTLAGTTTNYPEVEIC